MTATARHAAITTDAVNAVIGTRNASTVTAELVKMAISAALRPEVRDEGRTYRLYLNGHGVNGLFGSVVISRTSGKAIRANLQHGNHGREQHYTKVAGIRSALLGFSECGFIPEV